MYDRQHHSSQRAGHVLSIEQLIYTQNLTLLDAGPHARVQHRPMIPNDSRNDNSLLQGLLDPDKGHWIDEEPGKADPEKTGSHN